jgi:hypothetical protein
MPFSIVTDSDPTVTAYILALLRRDGTYARRLCRRGRSEILDVPVGFSRRLANHAAPIALHYTHHYNFCRIHKTLRVAPAMES